MFALQSHCNHDHGSDCCSLRKGSVHSESSIRDISQKIFLTCSSNGMLGCTPLQVYTIQLHTSLIKNVYSMVCMFNAAKKCMSTYAVFAFVKKTPFWHMLVEWGPMNMLGVCTGSFLRAYTIQSS